MSSPSRGELRAAAEFRLALRRFHSRTDAIVRRCGLTPRRYLLLLALEGAFEERHGTMGGLSDALGFAQSTTTELVQRAEDAGLVRRAGGAHDGRVVEVRSTAEGRRRLGRAFAALADEREQIARFAAELVEATDADALALEGTARTSRAP